MDDRPTTNNLIEYVVQMRTRLSEAHRFAREHLTNSLECMKAMYAKKAVVKNSEKGNEVLILLPLNGQPFKTR